MNNGFVTVNLFPYREKQKLIKIKQFSALMGLFAIGGLCLTLIVHGVLSVQIENQNNRNLFIEKENKKLDEVIKSISKLKEEIKLTLERRKVVEDLQVNRADGINIINSVANAIPEDMFLNSIKKTGDNVIIVGQTYSNNKVSHYMVGLDETFVFKDPILKEIKAKNIDNNKLKNKSRDSKINEFSLSVSLERNEIEEDAKVIPPIKNGGKE